MKSSTLTLRLDPELAARLERLVAKTGRSRTELVREALRRGRGFRQPMLSPRASWMANCGG